VVLRENLALTEIMEVGFSLVLLLSIGSLFRLSCSWIRTSGDFNGHFQGEISRSLHTLIACLFEIDSPHQQASDKKSKI
jgi:hypothetical protein